MKALIAVLLVAALSGCAVSTITINQYGPVQVSTGGAVNTTPR